MKCMNGNVARGFCFYFDQILKWRISYSVTMASNTGCLLESFLGKYEATQCLIYKENLPTVVVVKQNLILQASSYSQKILKNPFLGAHTGPVSKSSWL